MARILTAWGKSDVGKIRPGNEDALLIEPARGLFAVADGMGGHAAGEVASRMAVEFLKQWVPERPPTNPPQTLRRVVEMAGRAIHTAGAEQPELQGMGTTLTALWIPDDELILAHVGDSRGYRLRGGKLEQLTEDHSWVEEQVRAGQLTREEARSHALKNIITRSLGYEPEVEVDVLIEELREGDLYLLCSDGLSGPVPDPLIEETALALPPERLSEALVDLANDQGGPDNVTVVVVHVGAPVPVPPPEPPVG